MSDKNADWWQENKDRAPNGKFVSKFDLRRLVGSSLTYEQMQDMVKAMQAIVMNKDEKARERIAAFNSIKSIFDVEKKPSVKIDQRKTLNLGGNVDGGALAKALDEIREETREEPVKIVEAYNPTEEQGPVQEPDDEPVDDFDNPDDYKLE